MNFDLSLFSFAKEEWQGQPSAGISLNQVNLIVNNFSMMKSFGSYKWLKVT